MNEMIFIGSVLCYLGGVLVLYKFFGKSGLFIFTAFSTILANIQVCKCVDIFGVSTTAGNVLYAATFLVTDILSEKYGKREAQKAVNMGIFVTLFWIIGTQLTLQFTPNANDYISPSLAVVFGLVPRIAIASLIGYICSQSIDVFLYHFIWNKTGNDDTKLWMRNNGSTLCSQAVDTLIFTSLAFWGVYPVNVFVSILVTTYIFKAGVALMDTPFIYMARKIQPFEDDHDTRKTDRPIRRPAADM